MSSLDNLTKAQLKQKIEETEHRFESLNKRIEIYNNENYLRMVFESAQIGFITLDLNLKIIDYNHTYSEFAKTFYNKSPKVGLDVYELLPQDKKELSITSLNKVKNGEWIEFIDSFNFNNKNYYFKKIYSPLVSSEGNIEGILATVQDITTQEETRNKFLRTYNSFYTVLNSMQMMICVVDFFSYDIIFANHYFISINGEYIGKSYFDFFPNDELNLKEIRRRIRNESTLNSITGNINVHIKKFNRWFQINFRKIQWIEGNNPAVLMYLLDIDDQITSKSKLETINTELENKIKERTNKLQAALPKLEQEIEKRKITEQELMITKGQLALNLKREKELSTLKSRLLDNIAHEINTPLTVISSATFLIESYLKYGKYNEINHYIAQIQDSIQTLFRMVESAQKISSSTISNITLQYSSMNIVTFLNDLIMEVENIDSGKHIFQSIYQSNVVIYITDYRILRQILLQLIDNAMKFSNPGSKITIRLLEDDEKIYISVLDNGFGISEEDKHHIFEMFYRSKKYIGLLPGTGAGLTIAQANAALINAEIKFESQEGIGSEFSLVLPKS